MEAEILTHDHYREDIQCPDNSRTRTPERTA